MKNIVDKVNKQNPSLDSQIKNFLKELDRAKADGDVSAADAATLARLVQLFQ
jgi:ribosomal protein S20